MGDLLRFANRMDLPAQVQVAVVPVQFRDDPPLSPHTHRLGAIR